MINLKTYIEELKNAEAVILADVYQICRDIGLKAFAGLRTASNALLIDVVGSIKS